MGVTIQSGCKVNLLLNILGKRKDGFHELETIIIPVPVFDEIHFNLVQQEIELTCSHPTLSLKDDNLILRAARSFFAETKIQKGAKIHLVKNLPIGAGIGGGSANAAATFTTLNSLCGKPLSDKQLKQLAADLGSDIPFFLQPNPALATGRGEIVEPFTFQRKEPWALLLVFPGFGVSTPWAYNALQGFPDAIRGQPGRAAAMKTLLEVGDWDQVCDCLFNTLEVPVFHKFPLLRIYQKFLKDHGANGTLMSGSGATTFGLFKSHDLAERVEGAFRQQFGDECWIARCSI